LRGFLLQAFAGLAERGKLGLQLVEGGFSLGVLGFKTLGFVAVQLY